MLAKEDYWEERNQRISDEVTRKLQRMSTTVKLNNAISAATTYKEGETMGWGTNNGGTKCHLCGKLMKRREQEANTLYKKNGDIKRDTITNTITYRCGTSVKKTIDHMDGSEESATYVGEGCIKLAPVEVNTMEIG